jgi:hypothetical protein
MPLDATIRHEFALYCPGGCHGHCFWRKHFTCDVVKLLSKANIQKAQNGQSTLLIKATGHGERSNPTIRAKELSNFSNYQTLKTDRNW